MSKSKTKKSREAFAVDCAVYWSNLGRLNNLLVIVNISLFFLTGLVARGDCYTFYSLILLGVVGIGAIVPTGLIRRLWYYRIFLAAELAGRTLFAAGYLFGWTLWKWSF